MSDVPTTLELEGARVCPADGLRTSVIVGSYRRPDSLSACLAALKRQNRPADEIIVVVRADDLETLAVCARASKDIEGFRAVRVTRPGQVAALNAGLRVARGGVVAVTDDDAQPEPDWLEQITAIFAAEPNIGAIGGPDIIDGSTRPPVPRGKVGKISWYGRISGNHDVGTVREDVDILKGVNMSFRAAALVGFNEQLRGSGAQVGNDMEAALRVKRRGYRVVYEPRVRVRHYPAHRPDGQLRNDRSLKQHREQHYNETYTIVRTLPIWRAFVCTAYALLIGYRSAPGLAHMFLRLIAGPSRARAVAEWASVGVGRLEGLVQAINSMPAQPPVPPSPTMSSPLPASEDGAAVHSPTVSVCICTRNRPEALARTLESLRTSSFAPHQIVVADDSTDDRTSELVRRCYPEVTHRKGPRRGLGANRNAVVAAALGDFVLFLDDDCLLDPHFLERVLTRLSESEHPRRTIVTGGEINSGILVTSNDQGFLGFQNRKYDPSDVINSVVMNGTIFPRELFAQVRFDEQLIYGFDEVDLTTRAVAAGYRIIRCPEAVNHHFPSPVNRDYYGTHASAARLYVTFKRYMWTQRQPLRAGAFLFVAVLHLFVSQAKSDGVTGLLAVPGTCAEAFKAIVAHASSSSR